MQNRERTSSNFKITCVTCCSRPTPGSPTGTPSLTAEATVVRSGPAAKRKPVLPAVSMPVDASVDQQFTHASFYFSFWRKPVVAVWIVALTSSDPSSPWSPWTGGLGLRKTPPGSSRKGRSAKLVVWSGPCQNQTLLQTRNSTTVRLLFLTISYQELED